MKFNNSNLNKKPVPTKKPILDKNKVISFVLVLLIIFWTVASIFGLIGYGRATKGSSSIVASADEITEEVEQPAYYQDLNYFDINFPYTQNMTIFDGYYLSVSTADGYRGYWSFPEVPENPFSTANQWEYALDFMSMGVTFDRMIFTYLVLPGSSEFYITYRNTSLGLTYNYSTSLGWEDEGMRYFEILHSYTQGQFPYITNYATFIMGVPTDLQPYSFATLVGLQHFENYGRGFTFNGIPIVDSNGVVLDDQEAHYQDFTFSNYTLHHIPYFIYVDKAVGTQLFPTVGFRLLERIGAEIFIDDTSLYISYELYFRTYSSLLAGGSPQRIIITIYYDFYDYASGLLGDVFAYFPSNNSVVLLANEQYFFYSNTSYSYLLSSLRGAYDEGYNSNAYGSGGDFYSLISAVVDVPVRTFVSLFDLDILGINLSSFFLSLLSVGACLAIIRLLM